MNNSDSKIVSVCSFIALFIAAVLLFLCSVCGLSGAMLKWLDIVKDIALLVGIGVPAYTLIAGVKTKFWHIFYWVCFALYLFCIVWKVLRVLGVIAA